MPPKMDSPIITEHHAFCKLATLKWLCYNIADVRHRGQVARQSSAKARPAVRIRSVPPKANAESSPASVHRSALGITHSALHMIVGTARIAVYLPENYSLKDKRQDLK